MSCNDDVGSIFSPDRGVRRQKQDETLYTSIKVAIGKPAVQDRKPVPLTARTCPNAGFRHGALSSWNRDIYA
ncbi:unnamed protein product [Fusarium venenatum]|uniref:Uncharacterized protein n=1 Tax=Fusarium venenatum TaxID=56646 RepID=A0A2L2T3M6_9HYPO|nr:uncharacterized protein FVRRES_00671 [Fusarium venenatum]CEI64159.1 unnamed protein product [Fusarium venenatum]